MKSRQIETQCTGAFDGINGPVAVCMDCELPFHIRSLLALDSPLEYVCADCGIHRGKKVMRELSK